MQFKIDEKMPVEATENLHQAGHDAMRVAGGRLAVAVAKLGQRLKVQCVRVARRLPALAPVSCRRRAASASMRWLRIHRIGNSPSTIYTPTSAAS